MFRQVRILFALVILLFVSVSAYLTKERVTSWQEPLYVYVYPINGDGSQATQSYIDRLTDSSFSSIGRFMSQQASRYEGVTTEPFIISVSPQVNSLPPAPPVNGNVVQIMWWSLKLRAWTWTHNTDPGPAPDIQMYVLYYDPKNVDQVPHSVGLAKGLIGVVHAFSSYREQQANNIVIAHELMHTVGASDKYDLQTNQPHYPDGYANPDKQPLYPQRYAELMAGRIPISPNRADMVRQFSNTIIGPITAIEIRWDK